MKNYISADFHRIATKKSRILLMVLLIVGSMVYMLYGETTVGDDVIRITTGIGKLDFLYAWGIMLIIILISYGDDFRAKSMQVALGMGLTRRQVVFSKWISMTAIIMIDGLFLDGAQFAVVIATGKLAGSYVIWHTIYSLILNVLTIIMAMTLTMIILFQTQNAILGVLAYFYVVVGATDSIISMAAENSIVQRLHLWNIDVMNQMNRFIEGLQIGQFDIKSFLIVALYAVAGFELTIYLFKKKELDF